MLFESVIGLEVHAQLLTKSKIFCSCSTRFGAPPNSNTCPVCLGLPGALPVVNCEAIEMAVKAGLAFNCDINERSIFARKNYFYPDLPKGYQISQFQQPLAEDGGIEIVVRKSERDDKRDYRLKRFGIIRVHLEEDAGKSVHIGGRDTHVNLNRTGVPLIEIVSRPDLRSSMEAYSYLQYLRRTLLYLEICDGNMEEGSLRCDANVSVRPRDSKILGTKTEIKNLNSFRFLQKALDYEIQRQVKVVSGGGVVEQETRLWNEDSQRTTVMRAKEEAHDYRYFPEPDLLSIEISREYLEDIKINIPELPGQKKRRIIDQYGLTEEDAFLITQTPQLADYFEDVVRAYYQPKSVFNWMMGELAYYLKRDNQSIVDCTVKSQSLAGLIRLIDEGKISGKMAKQIFEKMYRTGKDPDVIVGEEGLIQMSNTEELEIIVDQILESHPEKVSAYRDGKVGLLGFFMGQVMRKTNGQANPNIVNEILHSKLL